MDEATVTTITFRCPPELEQVLPRPIAAVQGFPDWFKALPLKARSDVDGVERHTIKKCPPFIDAMAYGFLIPLVCDLKVENGEFSWDRDVPTSGEMNLSRSPIDFHDSSQVAGTPFFDDDRYIIKFNNFWTIETPPGYSLLFTHPVNRNDLPFTTITGLVVTDNYTHGMVVFPARWTDPSFSGVLPKGTPVAQCLPVKREKWASRIEALSPEGVARLHDTGTATTTETSVYRRDYRAPKR